MPHRLVPQLGVLCDLLLPQHLHLLRTALSVACIELATSPYHNLLRPLRELMVLLGEQGTNVLRRACLSWNGMNTRGWRPLGGERTMVLRLQEGSQYARTATLWGAQLSSP